MTPYTSRAGRVALVLVVTLMWTAGIDGQAFQIEGHVYDSRGKTLDGVTVSVWQGGKPTGKQATTTNGGFYSVLITKGQLVSRVQYTHNDYDPGEELHLSDQESHRISKVLYTPGEPRSLAATLETMSAFRDSLLFALNDPETGPAQRTQIRTLRFPAKLGALRVGQGATPSPAVSAYLSGERNQLMGIYQTLPQ